MVRRAVGDILTNPFGKKITSSWVWGRLFSIWSFKIQNFQGICTSLRVYPLSHRIRFINAMSLGMVLVNGGGIVGDTYRRK